MSLKFFQTAQCWATQLFKAFRKLLGAVSISLIGVLSFAWLLDEAGTFRYVEKNLTTVIALLHPSPRAGAIQVVLITDEDHEKIFGACLPIKNPARLTEIVDAIAMAAPATITVDIDTSAPEYIVIRQHLFPVPVIWARSASFSNKSKLYYPADVLGGRDWRASGISAVYSDEDGVVRRYRRSFLTRRGYMWSLPLASLHHASLPTEKDDAEKLITFYGDADGGSRPHRPPLSQIMSAAREDPEGWRKKKLFKDKIVLLGVAYAGQDEHQTPLGPMQGAEILAQIMETDHQNARPVDGKYLAAVVVAGALLLVLIFERARLRIAILAGVLIVLVIPILGAFILFHSVQQSWYLMTALLIVVVHRWVMRHIDKKRRLWLISSDKCLPWRRTLANELKQGPLFRFSWKWRRRSAV